MGLFSKGDAADQHLRAVRRELDEQCDREGKAMRSGDEAAQDRNLEIQERVRAAEKAASRGEKFRR